MDRRLPRRNYQRVGGHSKSAPVALLLILSVLMAGCGDSGGGGSSSSNGVWVANRVSNTLAVFSRSASKHSGAPAATRLNQSLSLVTPEGITFDKNNNLWVANCSGSSDFFGSIDKFTEAQLRNLKNDPAPDPDIEFVDDGSRDVFNCPYGLDFDKSGNLWATNRFAPNLISFSPQQLKQGGAQLPDTVITSVEFGDPEDITIDKSGSLWIADASFPGVLEYKEATLAAAIGTSSDINPDIIITSADLDSATAVTLDKSGNLWVANCGFTDAVLMFSASDLASSGSKTPAIKLEGTLVTTPTGTALSLDCPEGLTFDQSGNLWVSNATSDTFGSLIKFKKDQLAASGSPSPAVFLDADANGTNLNQPVLIDFGPL